MQYADAEIRPVEQDGERVSRIDGDHRPHPGSKSLEYRRVVAVDLSEDQARALGVQPASVVGA